MDIMNDVLRKVKSLSAPMNNCHYFIISAAENYKKHRRQKTRRKFLTACGSQHSGGKTKAAGYFASH